MRNVRRRIRYALAACLAIAGALLVLTIVGRDDDTAEPGPAIARSHGWRVTGARYERHDDAGRTLTVQVGEARVERLRLGAFRLGIAHRLLVRDAVVDVPLDGIAAADRKDALVELADPLAIVRANAADGGRIVAVHVDGVVVRLSGGDGRQLELRADECEASAFGRGRIGFRGDVQVRDAAGVLRFASLTYDSGLRRFVPAGAGTGDARAADADAVASANAALERALFPAGSAAQRGPVRAEVRATAG